MLDTPFRTCNSIHARIDGNQSALAGGGVDALLGGVENDTAIVTSIKITTTKLIEKYET